MKRNKPNFLKAEAAAYNLIERLNFQELPIEIEKAYKFFPDLRVRSYSWFAKKQSISIDEVIEITDSESGCCWYDPSNKRYMILYNDTISNRGHIRWTIAHEIGHYILKHNERIGKPIISRNSMSKTEYMVFEKEANCFARTLLAPPNVLSSLDNVNAHTIATVCQLSMEAASNVYKFMSEGVRRGIKYTHNKVAALFSQFVYRHKYGLECYTCGHSFTSEDAEYCSVCGQTSLSRPFYYNGVDNDLKYSGFELDENGRALICPRCENEDLEHGDLEHGDHCKVCGIFLINKCSDMRYYDGDLIEECGTILDGTARFCTTCGFKSTFFEKGLLKPWKEEKKEIEERLNPFPDPFVPGPKFNKPKATPFDDEEFDVGELLS